MKTILILLLSPLSLLFTYINSHKMRSSLPRRWCVAVDESNINIIGDYYAKQCNMCYRGLAGTSWKYYVSHDYSGISIMQGEGAPNYARTSLPHDHELITLDEFRHLVLGFPPTIDDGLPSDWYIKITEENYDEVGKWRHYGPFCTFTKFDPIGCCVSPNGTHVRTSSPVESKYKEISTETFRKYILGVKTYEPSPVQKAQAQPRVERGPVIITVPKI